MRCVIVLLALCSGCLVVPTSTTTARVVDSGVTDEPGPRGKLGLEVSRVGRTVVVKLQEPRTCFAQSYDIVETTESTTGRIAGADGPNLPSGSGEGALIGLALVGAFEIVALPVSGIITGVVVASSSDRKTQERHVTGVRKHACPVPAVHAAIGLEIPGGEILTRETDERGVAMFELPIEAPLTGFVTARAEQVTPVTIRY